MNLEEIKLLIEMIKDTDISEIDLEENGNKIRLKKGYKSINPDNFLADYKSVHNQDTKSKEEEEKESQEKGEKIVAPMVGTFYRSSAPNVDPYVKIGDIVNPGDILCIIEAMKLMNEIEAETKGKIVDILVKNGQTVEYGQTLFIIEPF